MSEEGTKILQNVKSGLPIIKAVEQTGLSMNDYYRRLPEGERIVISIERSKQNKRKHQLTTSILPPEVKLDFTILAKANRKTPGNFLASLVRKALAEAKRLS